MMPGKITYDHVFEKTITTDEKVNWFNDAIERLRIHCEDWEPEIKVTEKKNWPYARIVMKGAPNFVFTISPCIHVNHKSLEVELNMKMPQRLSLIQMKQIISVATKLQVVTESQGLVIK